MSWRLAGLVVVLACAHIEPPPGGPDDRLAPRIIATIPDSLASLPDFDDDVEFRFDEVVSEGSQPNFGTGSGTLEKLLLVSPSHEVPRVRWKRTRITVKPREGWQPNTTYRIELLPGVQDLRNNISKTGRVVTFTTGGELPTDTLRGRVVDWTTSRPAPNALVVARLGPDSTDYVTAADSTGRFVLGPLPRGEYVVFGVLDQNRNFRRDLRESFDSLRIAPGRDTVGELWAFRHDTVPARLGDIRVADSVTLSVSFSHQLDPYQRLLPDSVQVLALPDSVPLPVLGALPREAFDSAFPRVTPRDTAGADTTAAAADTAGPPAPAPEDVAEAADTAEARADTTERGPLSTRPKLYDQLQIRLGQALVSEGRYLVRLRGVRTVSGIEGSPQGALIAPERRPPPARDTTGGRDSTAVADTGATAAPDTAGARPDTAATADPAGTHPEPASAPGASGAPPAMSGALEPAPAGQSAPADDRALREARAGFADRQRPRQPPAPTALNRRGAGPP